MNADTPFSAEAIGQNIKAIKSTLPPGVELVAVSKFHPIESLRAAYEAGQRIFGESRVQELCAKEPLMSEDVQWHFIGHLQRNKVKALIGKTALIESVDSIRLLDAIDEASAAAGVVTKVLMQIHVAQEETKFGFTPEELCAYFSSRRFEQLKATHLCGVMGMATNTDDSSRINADFRKIADTRREILATAPDLVGFDTISMGMSDDYPLAIANGATHVRVGTSIFGHRQY